MSDPVAAANPGGAHRVHDAHDAHDAAIAELVSFYDYLAASEFDGYCDLYARLARAIRDDRELLELVITLAPGPKHVPILVFAAVHHLLLGEPELELAAIYRGAPGDPYPPFRAFVFDRLDDLRALTTSRTVQTNEVGRSPVVLVALTAVHRLVGRPLALVEIGPSAGLNLLFDRYHHDFGDGVLAGDPASPVRLTCAVRGPLRPPVPTGPLPVATRVGIDLAPVDVRDPEGCRWLEACVWPLVPDRADRLRAALGVARAEPPDLRTGSALELVPGIVRALPADVVPCLLSTWVLAYFSKDDRRAFASLLDDLGRGRDLAMVTCEYPGIVPWVAAASRGPTGRDGEGASLLGVTTWLGGERRATAAAWTHAHGRWIDWLDPASAAPGTAGG